jgi:hypothetical protein
MEIVIEKAREEDRPRIFELLRQANMHRVPSVEMPELNIDHWTTLEVDLMAWNAARSAPAK